MGDGTVGFKGFGTFRRLELPDGQDAAVSQGGRGAIRYNALTDQFEGSRNGASYETFGGAGGGGTTVANLTALAALDDTTFVDGANVAVASLRDSFELDTSSTLVVDGITVIATASMTGRWVRRELPSLVWVNQTTWYINETTGNDENDGSTAGTALATHGELVRRFGKLEVRNFITVNIASDLTQELVVPFNCVSEAGSLVGAISYVGATPTVVRSGTFTAGTQAWVFTPAASRQDGQVVDTGLGGGAWEIAAGQRIVATSGAESGAIGWVARNIAGNTARVSPWYDPAGGGESPGPSSGDTYNVEQLVTVTGSITIFNGAAVSFTDLCFVGSAPAGSVLDTNAAEGSIQLTSCDVRGFRVFLGMNLSAQALGCRLYVNQVHLLDGGSFTMGAGMLAGTMRMDVMSRYMGDLSASTLVQNPGASGAGGGTNVTSAVIDNRGGFFETAGSDNFAFYDFTAAGATIMDVSRNGGVLQQGNFFGRSCSMTTGLRVRSGCIYVYLALANPTPDIATPTGQDTLIGSTPTAFGALPASNTTSMCGIVATT